MALWVGIATGVRRGEVLALLWEDVDLENGIVYVRKQYGKEKVRKDPKKGSRRNIHIAPEVAKYLPEWKGEQAGAPQSMGYAHRVFSPRDCESTVAGWSYRSFASSMGSHSTTQASSSDDFVASGVPAVEEANEAVD